MAVIRVWLGRKKQIKKMLHSLPFFLFFCSQSEFVLSGVASHLTNSRYASGSCLFDALFLLGTVDYLVHVRVAVCDGTTLNYMQQINYVYYIHCGIYSSSIKHFLESYLKKLD